VVGDAGERVGEPGTRVHVVQLRRAATLAEFISLAKGRPGDMNYGTPGNGTSGHLCTEYLKSRAGIDLQHVPYRGSGAVIPAPQRCVITHPQRRRLAEAP
jgi:tripartite-type tricarboxylate transporter receptor subunit TctC